MATDAAVIRAAVQVLSCLLMLIHLVVAVVVLGAVWPAAGGQHGVPCDVDCVGDVCGRTCTCIHETPRICVPTLLTTAHTASHCALHHTPACSADIRSLPIVCWWEMWGKKKCRRSCLVT